MVVQAIRPLGSQILMGKNTLMKRCIRLYCENKKDDSWGALLEDLVGNIGVLFVRDDFAVRLLDIFTSVWQALNFCCLFVTSVK